MANLGGTFDATQVEPNGDFDPVPAGEYRAMIVDSEITAISEQNDFGKCLNLSWKIDGGPHDGRLVWQRLNLWAENFKSKKPEKSDAQVTQESRDIAQREFSSICHATGKLSVQDSEELHHLPCLIKVTIKTDKTGQYPPKNEVKGIKAADGTKPATGGFGGGGQQAAPANQQAANSGGGSLPWKKTA